MEHKSEGHFGRIWIRSRKRQAGIGRFRAVPVQKTESLQYFGSGRLSVMIRRLAPAAFETAIFVSSLWIILFLESYSSNGSGCINSIRAEVNAALRDSGIQWLIVFCLGYYVAVLMAAESRGPVHVRFRDLNVWLCALLVLAAMLYALHYHTASETFEMPLFLLNIVAGKCIVLWVRRADKGSGVDRRILRCLSILVFLLVAGTLVRPGSGWEDEYQGAIRWGGVWDNPNVCGMLMGVGAILSFGILASNFACQSSMVGGYWRTEVHDRRSGRWVANSKWRGILCGFLWSVVPILCGIGLFESYSRGAWVGATVGIGYLIFQIFSAASVHSPQSAALNRGFLWFSRNRRAVAVIGVSLAILAFWQFRFTEWRPARRMFSVANINDFSWRNRVIAWDGAIRMVAQRPWFGFGWGEAESVYEEKYRPPQLDNGAAIQMNDYFMLGISAGVPALVCFLIYVGLSLRSPQFRFQSPRSAGTGTTLDFGLWTADRAQAACRAGAIVLLVGFWFDGGLFKVATGSVFWILLELGRLEPRMDTNAHESGSTPKEPENEIENANSTRLRPTAAQPGGSDEPSKLERVESWFSRLAWVVVSLAFVETVVLVGTPFLRVNTTTLRIARHWLIPPRAVADLDFLANGSSLRNQKLRILLQHASLANYNRQLINWKLDDQIYRDYVLKPTINPERDDTFNWRRTLWEYFYQPVRKENDPQAAANVVMKFLRQRITIAPTGHEGSQEESSAGPSTIEEMWRQGKADAKGFEALKVAAFRSVGIPARLNESGQAELFADGKWNVAREA